MIDSHCHLEPDDYPDPDAVFERARAAGLRHVVLIGQLQADGSFGAALALARRSGGFARSTAGVHPHEAARATPALLEELSALCALDEVVAVGEAGLDYYYNHSPRSAQAEVFAVQCRLARRLGKPLVVHVRDAHEDCVAVLRSEGVERGVIHCFTGDVDAARRYVELGFHVSISGIVTYKKTEALQEAVRFVPLERLLVETDSPYLAPVPFRGKKNEPAWVCEVARRVAELRGEPLELIDEATTENARRLFAL